MDYSILTKIPLFKDVLPEELEKVFQSLSIKVSRFKKGEILTMQGEPVNRLVVLLTVEVKAEMADTLGRVIRVEDVKSPNPLAIMFLFGKDNRFPVQATAQEDTDALIIPKQSVLKMLAMNETILKNYLDISSDFAARLSRKLHFMTFRTIRQKMALYVSGLSEESGSDRVRLGRTKSALAEYFGVSRPALEREITNMERDGLIAADRREIIIIDKKELSKLISM